MMRTPDGHGKLELTRVRAPAAAPRRAAGRRPARWACIASCSLSTTSITPSPACAPTGADSSARWHSRASSCSATSAAPRASSSPWPNRSADASPLRDSGRTPTRARGPSPADPLHLLRCRSAYPKSVLRPLPNRPHVGNCPPGRSRPGDNAATRRYLAVNGRIMANRAAAGHASGLTWPSRKFWWSPTRRGRGLLGRRPGRRTVPRVLGFTSVVLRFAGTWLLLVSGGGPTADKPTVVFQPPADANLVSHAMTLRVGDCRAAYEALRSRGAAFLTPPHDWGSEIRCFLRDPDGHLVEISQSKAS